jgi:hypothetical protein
MHTNHKPLPHSSILIIFQIPCTLIVERLHSFPPLEKLGEWPFSRPTGAAKCIRYYSPKLHDTELDLVIVDPEAAWVQWVGIRLDNSVARHNRIIVDQIHVGHSTLYIALWREYIVPSK